MQYTLKKIDELRVGDLKTIMLPNAAAQSIRSQSKSDLTSNVHNLADYSDANSNLVQDLESGVVVLTQAQPEDELSILSSKGKLSNSIPEQLGNKVSELLGKARAVGNYRFLAHDVVTKDVLIRSVIAEQQAMAANQGAQSSSQANSASSSASARAPEETATSNEDKAFASEKKEDENFELTVELAGQWPMNSASLFLEKSDAQNSIMTRPRADRTLAHRSLSTFKSLKNEPKNLYLNLPTKNRTESIKLLLAENLTPVEKDTEMDEWDNVLVPVRPLAYLDEEKNKANAAELKGGYLYLFWKGKLWRELKVTERSYYQDINVAHYRELASQGSTDDTHDNANNKRKEESELRPAEGFPLPDLWIPYKLGGEVQSGDNGLKLLFWPEQLTFEEIEHYESTPDELDKYAAKLDGVSAYSQSKAFTEDQHISDLPTASLMPVTGNDVPWLGNATSLFGRLQNSNIAAAYLDGQNRGIRVLVDVGLELDEDTQVPTILAHLTHDDSDWEQTTTLEPRQDSEWSNWRTATFYAIPEGGFFSLYLINPESQNDYEEVFRSVTYRELAEFNKGEVKEDVIDESGDDEAVEELITDEMKQEFTNILSTWDL